MIIWVYDRWGEQVDCIGDFIGFAYDDEVGKVETVEFDVPGVRLSKGDYLVWRDGFGDWHEDIVASTEVIHDGAVRQHVYAEDSLVELDLSYIGERDSYGLSNSVALTRCLEGTRWVEGTVQDLGIGNIKFYHTTVYGGIVDMVDEWGGEIETAKRVGPNGVYERRLSWFKERGRDNSLMFFYGFDADGIQRMYELDNVCTRVHVFGKGEPTYGDDGEVQGYGRRITFADINGGKDYVEDLDALEVWGVIGKGGKLQPSEGTVVFDQCEDPEELLKLGRAYLDQVKVPRVTYKADVAILADYGMDYKDVRAGDRVYIVDDEMGERLNGRVSHIRRFEDGRPAEVTLGNVVRSVSDIFQETRSSLESLRNRATAWDGAAQAEDAWIDNAMFNINENMNASGGYVYWEQGEGITVLDRRRDDDPTMAIQLKGAGFRIANSKTSTGEWNWRTFGTGDGFTADLLNVGTIRGGANYWNLESGDLSFSKGSISDAWGNSWNMTTGALSWKHGSIGDAQGNAWNMTTGAVTFKNGSISDSKGNTWNMTTGVLDFEYGTINARTITAGSLTVKNSAGQTILQADLDNKTASVGGMKATGDELQGGNIRLNKDHYDVYSSSGQLCGTMGLTVINGGSSVGIWGQGSMGGLSLGAGGFNVIYISNVSSQGVDSYRDWDFHGHTLNNANIPSSSSISIADAVDDEMRFIAVTKVNPDGTIAEYAEGCSLGFTNGILTTMVKPDEEE